VVWKPDEVVPYKVLPPVVESLGEVFKSRLMLFSNPKSKSEFESDPGMSDI
jgi:hypothetical protein